MIAGNAIDLLDSERRLGAYNYKPLDIVLSRGRGAWVWDVDGNRYLDCLSAYSAVNQGHCHPRIMAALNEQAGKLTITSRAFRNDKLALLYEKLAGLTVREREILDRMVAGHDRADIAVDLGISINTVRTHAQNLLGKLGVHSTLEAVSVAHRAVNCHRPGR